MTSVIVRKNEIDVVSRETYTAGSVNVYTVKAKLSAEWKALSATPVFRAGSVRISTVFDEFGCCVIPHEVLENAGQMLEFGVFGVNESGAELPTIWAKLDYIREGTSPGDNAVEPTPSLYDQLVGQVGDAVNDARGYAQSAAASKDAAESAERGAELSAGYAAENAEDSEAAARAAAKSETAAGAAAKDAQTAAEAAVKAAQGAAADKASADTAARNAAEAKAAARGAAETAEAAKTAAAASASSAQASKTGAETAKTGAETAKTAAETAKTGAETAKTAAETARDAAQRYAGDAQDALSGAHGIAEGKLDKPETPPTAAGKVLRVLSVNDDGTFVCEWADDAAGVTDVRVAGESIVADDVADVPVAATGKYGVVKIGSVNESGLDFNANNNLSVSSCANTQINGRSTGIRPIVPTNLDYAVKAAMCDGKGAAWTADEQAAARVRMGVGEYQLINDITLEEDTVEVLVSSEQDGTPYNLKKFIVIMTGFPSDIGDSYYRIDAWTKETQNLFLKYLKEASMTGKYIFLSYESYRPNLYKVVTGIQPTGSNFSTKGTADISSKAYSGKEISDTNITKINFKRAQSDYAIQSGINIKIYGVRA